MDDKLNEDVNMLQTSSGVCHAYPLALAKVPQMRIHLTTLDGKIVLIKAKAQQTGIGIKGLYIVKSASKTDLVNITEAGCAAIRSHATLIGDQNLKESAQIKGYQLERLHKNDLITTSTNFLAVATGLGALLVPYGFEATDLTDWQTMLATFTTAAEDPGVKREIHKSDLADLKKLVADTLHWVSDVMDDTAIAFKRKDPPFHQLYTFAREKHHQGHRARKPGEEDITSPGEYLLEVPRGGTIKKVDFPILPNNTYLIESLKNRLRFWNQASPDAPATIPEDAGIIELAEEIERTGASMGAPEKPYMFVANESTTEDGQVAVNIVEE